MNSFQITRKINGTVHWCDEQLLIRSVGSRIDISHDNGKSFQRIAKVPLPTITRFAAATKIGRRALRTNVKHCLKVSEELFIVFVGKAICQLNIKTRELRQTAQIVGSRPLRICFGGGAIFYGEYRRNLKRSPISLFRSDDLGESWQIAWQFDDVRHIHGVFADPRNGSIWLTTGDTDSESAIWNSQDNFKSINKIIAGSQQCRVIDLLFDDKSIFFGSDAPDEVNWIYRFDRESQATTPMQQVAGPVFHGATIAGQHFFSTVCEPSQVNTSKYCEIWTLPLIDSHGTWQRVRRYRKDFWPLVFEYGQVILPAGPGTPCEIWLSPYATRKDQTSLLIRLTEF